MYIIFAQISQNLIRHWHLTKPMPMLACLMLHNVEFLGLISYEAVLLVLNKLCLAKLVGRIGINDFQLGYCEREKGGATKESRRKKRVTAFCQNNMFCQENKTHPRWPRLCADSSTRLQKHFS